MSDISGVLSSVRWADESFYLKEFLHKFKLPQVVKVVKGQYVGLGVSTLSSPSLQSTILLCHAPPRPALLAQSVKFKDGKRVVPMGPKLSIPQSYEGYFEILSEEGRSVRCIESVSELARRFPESVLVRENIKAFVSKSDNIETIHDKARVITVGEILILVGEVLGVKGKNQTRYLRCFDREGENVFLPWEQKGRFSAVAKEDNISGVHSIKNIVKKRLPLMARLAHGAHPHGLKSNQVFLPELRILGRIEEAMVVALPLSRDSSAVYVPLAANLKLQPTVNGDYISGMPEVARLQDRVKSQLDETADSMVVFDTSLPRELDRMGARLTDKAGGGGGGPTSRKPSVPQSDSRRSSNYGIISTNGRSNDGMYSNGRSNADGVYGRTKDGGVYSNGGSSDGVGVNDYDEIDQIYDYVRGFAPLPKSAKGWQFSPDTQDKDHHHRPDDRKEAIYGKLKVVKESSRGSTKEEGENKPPEPPPIETIPSRRHHQDLSPPATPLYSPPWGSPTHLITPLGPNGQMLGNGQTPPLPVCNGHTTLERAQSADQRIYEKSSESKKRQRPKTADYRSSGGDKTKTAAAAATPPARYVKAAHKQSGGKHKFFKSRGTKEKDAPPPLGASVSSRGGGGGSAPQPSFFHLRYKSLTNLTQQEYDTLDSSNSGGKTSFDSAGSRNIPEKRSRKLTRPKSLTNLVWDFRTTSPNHHHTILRSNSKPSLLVADKGRQEGRGGRETRLARGRGRTPSPATKRIVGKNLSSTLYL